MSLRSFNPAFAPLISETKTRLLNLIISPKKCQAIVDRLDLSIYKPGTVDVIEVFAANLLFGSMINHTIKPRNHYLIEHNTLLLRTWKSAIAHLEQTTNNVENYKIFNLDAYQWETYSNFFANECKVQTQSRNQVHSELLLIANLTMFAGEALLAQWLSCGIYHNWIQRYGRVRMIIVCPEVLVQKFISLPGSPKRNRSSVKFDLYSDINLHAISGVKEFTSLSYPGKGFELNRIIRDQPVLLERSEQSRPNLPMAVIDMVPKETDPNNDFDYYFHILQILFTGKESTIGELLSRVAPGAEDLTPELGYLVNKLAKDLSRQEWEILFAVFDKWPFRPGAGDLFDLEIEDRR